MFPTVNINFGIIISGLIFLAAYLILGMIIMRPVIAYDTFWHLQMGKDLFEQGYSPWVDHYSVRHLGADISSIPVLFQVLLYQFVDFFGEQAGFYYIKLFYITLMLLVLWSYFRIIKSSSYIVFVFLPLIVSAISLRLIIRPELFSFVLVVICLILYLNAQQKFSIRNMLAICLLLLFWTSYHSPIIGYILIFGLFLEKAINKILHADETVSWSQWALWGALIFSIGFTSFRFNGSSIVAPHFLIGMVEMMSAGFSHYIVEYNNSYDTHTTNVQTHVSWMLSIYVAIWSLIKRQYGFAFVVVLLTISSWFAVRMLAVVLIINMCVLALYWSQFINSSHYLTLRASVRKALLIVSSCLSLMIVYFLVDDVLVSMQHDKSRLHVLDKRYPVQAAGYLLNYQDGGNILNVLQHGGYLLYKLSPDYKVYYDGRSSILYPIEFVKHNNELWRSSKSVDNVVEKYDISFVLRKNSVETFMVLKKTKSLELSFADDNYFLFSRKGKADFPLVSTLLVLPHCWNNDYYQDNLSLSMRSEIERSEKLFTDKQYTLTVALEFIDEYLAADNKKKFFSDYYFSGNHSDAVRRIAFYIAMEEADKDTVSDLFAIIGLKHDYDILIYSYYLAKNGEYEDAENLAYYFYTLDKAGEIWETHDKFGILGRVFRILKEHNQLQQFETSYVDKLDANLKKVNYPFDRELSFDFMCK